MLWGGPAVHLSPPRLNLPSSPPLRSTPPTLPAPLFQAVATILFVTAFILPFRTFARGATIGSQPSLVQAHAALGIALMAALPLHLIVALFRPKPDAPTRRRWNGVHWWTGRGLALVGFANVLIGAALYAQKFGSGELAEWLVPALLAPAMLLAVHLWLRASKRRIAQPISDYGHEGGAGGAGAGAEPGKVEFGTGYMRYREAIAD